MQKNGNEIEVLLYLATGQTVAVYMDYQGVLTLSNALADTTSGSVVVRDSLKRYSFRGVVGFAVV